MITTIILFGQTGMLGNYIYSFFKTTKYNVKCINERITETNIHSVEEWLVANGIDNTTCIINCIGQIPQRSQDARKFVLINSIFPHILWSVCKKYNARMIQPTTDCVFSGTKPIGNYTENDIHDETGLYGISKSLGEPPECTVLRTSIIGREKYNKASFMEWVLNSTNEIDGWNNHYWNGITCLEYCHIVRKILDENLFWKGVKHIYSPNTMSKYEMVECIKEAFGITIGTRRVSVSDTIDKTLMSIYEPMFPIQSLEKQIKDLASFHILYTYEDLNPHKNAK